MDRRNNSKKGALYQKENPGLSPSAMRETGVKYCGASLSSETNLGSGRFLILSASFCAWTTLSTRGGFAVGLYVLRPPELSPDVA